MGNIEDFKSKMTIFYNKRIGIITGVFSGKQDYSVFGDEADDFKAIYGRIVIPMDMEIFNNYRYYKVVNEEIIYNGKFPSNN